MKTPLAYAVGELGLSKYVLILLIKFRGLAQVRPVIAALISSSSSKGSGCLSMFPISSGSLEPQQCCAHCIVRLPRLPKEASRTEWRPWRLLRMLLVFVVAVSRFLSLVPFQYLPKTNAEKMWRSRTANICKHLQTLLKAIQCTSSRPVGHEQ